MTTHTDWIIRPETDADIPVIREINRSAFDTPLEADLVDALRADSAWIPGLSMVAQTPEGTIAGYALLTRCHIDDTPALCLAPVAVLPEFQRTGAGAAAIRAVLDAARDRGEHIVTVLGHPAYYPRFGFTPASGYGIRPTFEVPDEAMMVLGLDDRPLPSGTLHYAAPFGI
ncbi:GNAT family N-acetyltransferase [Streptomyces syringium]|uniref:GNAT family N-acetyltransferase n=1 Tax=Streptomyces syringium TaxID=76729 RepID=UPI0036AD1B95